VGWRQSSRNGWQRAIVSVTEKLDGGAVARGLNGSVNHWLRLDGMEAKLEEWLPTCSSQCYGGVDGGAVDMLQTTSRDMAPVGDGVPSGIGVVSEVG
jgi:hypothetical protein